jgi:predicted amidohydrolase
MKSYLHADEEPFFSGKLGITGIRLRGVQIAFAICYELSVAVHPERAFNEGASVYIASVAKSSAGVDMAKKHLSEIAAKYSMTVLMSNAVGPADNFLCGGKSAAWNSRGELMGELDDNSDGLLIYDTENNAVTSVQF